MTSNRKLEGGADTQTPLSEKINHFEKDAKEDIDAGYVIADEINDVSVKDLKETLKLVQEDIGSLCGTENYKEVTFEGFMVDIREVVKIIKKHFGKELLE